MSINIIQGRYTLDGVRGMMKDPSDREAAIRPLIEAAGAKLLHYYVTYGDYDFMVITEGGDDEGVMAALMAASASGMVSNMKTTTAFTSAQFKAAAGRAGQLVASFKPIGG